MASKFEAGKFTYDTYVTTAGAAQHVQITLDLNHPEIRDQIYRALRNKSGKAVEAGGALVTRIVS